MFLCIHSFSHSSSSSYKKIKEEKQKQKTLFFAHEGELRAFFLLLFSPWRRKFSRRSSGDSNPGPFDHESNALTAELSRSLSVQGPLGCSSLLAHPRHCSSLSQLETSLKTTLFTLPTLSCSNPFTGIGCCTWLHFLLPTSSLADWCFEGMGGGETWREGNEGLIYYVCVCTCVGEG